MNKVLAGKVCLITGTTGIGAASARLFAREGARVCCVGREEDHARQLAESLRADGGEATFYAEDLTLAGAAERALAACLEAFDRLDVLLHIAGISGRKFGDGPLHECTDAGWDTVLDTNVKALFQLNRACLRHWLEHQRPGNIINMASVLGFSPEPKFFATHAYAASKGAIIALSRAAAAYYAPHGIRVNVIAPALVDTPMAQRAVQDPMVHKFLTAKQPLIREALTDEDVAAGVLYLAADASRAVTGTVLVVDGGWCVSGG
jgi:NAD(P)-dependent dehydrogenase (short-subunit alcohol dehydrogenase family)